MSFCSYCFSFQRIGEIFLNKGLLTKEQLSIILKSQKNKSALFGQLAVSLGFLSENDLLKELSELFTIKPVSLEFLYLDKWILDSMNHEIARTCKAIPFFIDESTAKVAIVDPGDIKSLDIIKSHFNDRNVEFYIAKESEILRFLEIMNNNREEMEKDPLFILNKVIFDAVEKNTSDIHFEPQENFIRIRFRVDGVLLVYDQLEYEFWDRIRSKLKLMANLNIAESRRSQSGHSRIYLAGRNIDLRVSTHAGTFGENFVIRIFDLATGICSLTELGFCKKDYLWLKNISRFPSGLFLIVGPTGSGKTTTLYSLLKEINSSTINIMTLEDPVEYQIEGIKQMELHEDGLLSFSDGVRSILRQDPDVLLIGEIRDEETAAMAVRASLTGRLVLASLHAATPLDGLRRLLDLGPKLQDFLPSLIGIFSQRLARYLVDSDDKTQQKSYKGRFPITEYIYFSEILKKRLLDGKSINICKSDKTFKDSYEEAVAERLTDYDEIRRIFGDADIQV